MVVYAKPRWCNQPFTSIYCSFQSQNDKILSGMICWARFYLLSALLYAAGDEFVLTSNGHYCRSVEQHQYFNLKGIKLHPVNQCMDEKRFGAVDDCYFKKVLTSLRRDPGALLFSERCQARSSSWPWFVTFTFFIASAFAQQFCSCERSRVGLACVWLTVVCGIRITVVQSSQNGMCHVLC